MDRVNGLQIALMNFGLAPMPALPGGMTFKAEVNHDRVVICNVCKLRIERLEHTRQRRHIECAEAKVKESQINRTLRRRGKAAEYARSYRVENPLTVVQKEQSRIRLKEWRDRKAA